MFLDSKTWFCLLCVQDTERLTRAGAGPGPGGFAESLALLVLIPLNIHTPKIATLPLSAAAGVHLLCNVFVFLHLIAGLDPGARPKRPGAKFAPDRCPQTQN